MTSKHIEAHEMKEVLRVRQEVLDSVPSHVAYTAAMMIIVHVVEQSDDSPNRLQRAIDELRDLQATGLVKVTSKHDLLTTDEAAVFARVHIQTVRRWLRSGLIRSAKIGRRRLIPRSELERVTRIPGIPSMSSGGFEGFVKAYRSAMEISGDTGGAAYVVRMADGAFEVARAPAVDPLGVYKVVMCIELKDGEVDITCTNCHTWIDDQPTKHTALCDECAFEIADSTPEIHYV